MSNIQFRDLQCKEKNIQSYIDNTDRIEEERGFSLAKRCYGIDPYKTGYNHPQFDRIINTGDKHEPLGSSLFLAIFDFDVVKVR